jgi:nicotinamidase-related amidase
VTAGAPTAPAADSEADHRRTALLVVDMQNDFCAGDSADGGRKPGREALAAVVDNTRRAVRVARQAGMEVIFIRFLGDEKYQGASWRARNRRLGKRTRCREGTWGAEFHEVRPTPDERVFTKLAHFDAFLVPGFDEYLSARGIATVVMAGLFSDVCVDSTARGAFQRGYHVTVLADCTTSLHLEPEAMLRFMGVLYGARITTGDEVFREQPATGPAA